MKAMLMEYYNMDIDYIDNSYFYYENKMFFVMKCNPSFLEIYALYEYIMHSFQVKGYRLIRNKYNQVMTDGYIVMMYENEGLEMRKFVYHTLLPFQMYNLDIIKIKERWIDKIDCVRKEVGKYSYSFQYNKDLNALIHYYCGMGETAIGLLNEILENDKNANLSLCLSLKHKIHPYDYEILNPGYYDISTRSRHLLNLMKSNIVTFDSFDDIVCHFNVVELMYMMARSLYCSEFFDLILNDVIDENSVVYFIENLNNEIGFIKSLRKKLSKFISLSEISWID